MSILFPIGAAILQACSFTLDKVTLSIKRVTHKTYMSVSFPLIFIFTLIIFLIMRPPLTIDLFAGKLLWLIIAIIIMAIITNWLFYRALKKDFLSEIQTFSLLRDLPLILFAALIFPDERNWLIIGLAGLAVLAIVWSHWEKGHFQVAKKTWPYLLWTIIFAPVRHIFAKILLEVWNPISLQLVSEFFLAAFVLIAFNSSFRHTPKKAIPFLLVTNLFTTVAWILYYFGYQKIGIVHTVLLFTLQPMLVYLASILFLKEKFEWKKFTAFIIVLGVIAISQLV